MNFGGEHFGAGYNVAVGVVSYNWLVDNGSGALVKGPAVQVSTPIFTYYPPVAGHPAPAQVQVVNVDAIASADAGDFVNGSGTYAVGANAVLSAAPNHGYTFTHWVEGNTVVSTAADYAFTVGTPRSLVAVFNPIPDVDLTPGAPGSGVLMLSWADADRCWVLQESADLVTWVNSPRHTAASGGRKSASASTAAERRFFRLVHP